MDDITEFVALTATQLAAKADDHWDIKTKRLAADKVAAALKTSESALEAEIIAQMLHQQITSIGGKTVIYGLPKPTMEPVVQDWQKYWEFIKQTDDISLFEKRPGRAAIKERWGLGETIPGVVPFAVYKLSKTGVK